MQSTSSLTHQFAARQHNSACRFISLLLLGMALLPAGVARASTISGFCNTGFTNQSCTIEGAQGTVDGNWSLSALSATPYTSTSTTFGSALIEQNGAWLPVDNSTSQWISPTANTQSNGGFYLYQTSFTASSALNDTISGRWISDNEGWAVFLNGIDVSLCPTVNFPGAGATAAGTWASFSITNGCGGAIFNAGTNVLDFEVRNRGLGGDPANPTATGFRAEVSGASGAVPEPQSVFLLGAGLTLMLWFMHRQKQGSAGGSHSG